MQSNRSLIISNILKFSDFLILSIFLALPNMSNNEMIEHFSSIHRSYFLDCVN